MAEQKKKYTKPEITIHAPGSPKYNEIIALLNAEVKSEQSNTAHK